MIFAGSIASVRFSVTQKSRSALQPLQVVHVVGDGAQRLGLAQQVEVPGGARETAAGEQGGVGVEDRLVALVGDRAEHLALARGGVAQQRERLVGVGGDHDLVE